MKREREEERVSAADWAGNGIEDWLRADLAAHAQIPAEQAEKEWEREREQGREGVGEAGAADGGVAEGGTETANQKQKAMSIAVTNKLTGHLCLLPLPVSPACTFPCISVCFPCLPTLRAFPCPASRTGTCSLSIYASVWTEVAGAFWNYQAKYSLRCLRISISRCPSRTSTPKLYEELCVCSTFLPRAA